MKSVDFDTGEKVECVTDGGAEEEQCQWNGLSKRTVSSRLNRRGERETPSRTKIRLRLPCTCLPNRYLSQGFYEFD